MCLNTNTKRKFVTKEVALKKRISVGGFQINKEEKAAINEVLDAGRISEWKKVKEFENLFAIVSLVPIFLWCKHSSYLKSINGLSWSTFYLSDYSIYVYPHFYNSGFLLKYLRSV